MFLSRLSHNASGVSGLSHNALEFLDYPMMPLKFLDYLIMLLEFKIDFSTHNVQFLAYKIHLYIHNP